MLATKNNRSKNKPSLTSSFFLVNRPTINILITLYSRIKNVRLISAINADYNWNPSRNPGVLNIIQSKTGWGISRSEEYMMLMLIILYNTASLYLIDMLYPEVTYNSQYHFGNSGNCIITCYIILTTVRDTWTNTNKRLNNEKIGTAIGMKPNGIRKYEKIRIIASLFVVIK